MNKYNSRDAHLLSAEDIVNFSDFCKEVIEPLNDKCGPKVKEFDIEVGISKDRTQGFIHIKNNNKGIFSIVCRPVNKTIDATGAALRKVSIVDHETAYGGLLSNIAGILCEGKSYIVEPVQGSEGEYRKVMLYNDKYQLDIVVIGIDTNLVFI